jgi:hypothetical protein
MCATHPACLQLSLDGKRLYVTNSLYSVWDNQVSQALLCAQCSRALLVGRTELHHAV